MNSHTPGPWNAFEPAPDVTCQVIARDSAIRVADVWCTDMPDGAANARLIAAAPDLLQAAIKAEELLSLYVVQTGEPGEALDGLRAAIAKAESTA